MGCFDLGTLSIISAGNDELSPRNAGFLFTRSIQYQNYKRRRNVPSELTDVMTEDGLEKARTYAMDKMRYNEIHSVFNEVETTVTISLFAMGP